MPYLVATTLLWAFSFSLISEYIAGYIDSWFAVLTRIILAFILFLPFWRWRGVNPKQALLFMAVGALQLAIMYLFYYHSFLYLTVPEILLFTIFTPIYITLFYDLLKKQKLKKGYLLSAALGVLGAAVIRYDQLSSGFWVGFCIIQGANICFAVGQVGYKRLIELYPMPQKNAFSWFYFGALCVAIIAWFLFGNANKIPTTLFQWGILIWLGIGASGIGYFMWNYGATKVDAGTLAIMNNALIPAGIAVNLLFWNQEVNWLRFGIGTVIIVISLFIHKYIIIVNEQQNVSEPKSLP